MLYNVMSQMLAARNHCERREYLKKNPSAAMLGKKECVQCGFCCLTRPGDLTPDDIQRLADFFKMTVKDFFQQYCVVDGLETEMINDSFVVLLRRNHQPGNWFVSFEETYSVKTPCVFFQNKECVVHDCKPACCTRHKCWDNETAPNMAFEYAHKWTRGEIENMGYTGVFEDAGL